MKQRRNWKPHYNDIIELYNNGMAPSDIAKKYNTIRTTIKNIISTHGKLRTASESAVLSHKHKKPKIFICKLCKTQFESKACRALYCSTKCIELSRPDSQKKDFICTFCNKPFKRRNPTNSGLYCSKQCAGLVKLNNPSTYTIKAFIFYDTKCDICGLDDLHTLVVHHKNHNEFDHRIENLQILCANCHIKHHTHKSTKKRKMLDRIKKYKDIKGLI